MAPGPIRKQGEIWIVGVCAADTFEIDRLCTRNGHLEALDLEEMKIDGRRSI